MDTLDANTIYVSYYCYAAADDLKFAKSTDGGSTWTPQVIDGTIGGDTSLVAVGVNAIYIGYEDAGIASGYTRPAFAKTIKVTYIGIGTSSPQQKLHVIGNVTISDNLGIGTISPSNILTVVQNSPTDPIADSWLTYSSIEYKENIRKLSKEEHKKILQELLETDVVWFNWKNSSEQRIGIIAEEAPSLLLATNNSTDLAKYITALHVALKAQQELIEKLEARIIFLENNQHLPNHIFSLQNQQELPQN
jgi:hypothetical protein